MRMSKERRRAKERVMRNEYGLIREIVLKGPCS